MPHQYTDEQKAFIREVAPGRYNKEIAELFNERFGTNLTDNMMRSFKKNHGIRSNVPTRRQNENAGLFNKEQRAFIKKHVAGTSNQKLTDLVNKKFGLSVTVGQIRTWKKNHGVTSGLSGHFKKGCAPWNKGKKGLKIGGVETQFKKGHKPLNYRPVGSERIDNKDGYVWIKVQDGGRYQDRWKLKHKVIWEEANGPVPPEHKLLFLDQNKLNVSLDNLILIPQSKLSTLNKKGLLSNDPDLTKTGIIVADIYQKISARKKKRRAKE